MSKNWIFLRGLTRGVIHWGEFANIFKEQNPEGIVEFLEVPGNGEKCAEHTPVDPKKIIDLLRHESVIVKNNYEYNLCGISLGGMIALKWAELYPEKINSVVVINTSLSQCSPMHLRLIPKNYRKILGLLFENNSLKSEKVILNMTCNFQDSIRNNMDIFAEYAHNHPVTFSNFLRQLILAKNIKINDLDQIPLRVICSENDHLVSFQCSKNISKKFNGKLYIHPSAGHDLPLDDAKWISNILANS